MTAAATDTSADIRALERAIAGRYALERELGRGGMGVVLLARDLSLDRLVALKLLPAVLAAQPVLRERFLREARTAAGLSHPHVVPIHAVEAHGDIVFIAMAFVDGESLAERVRRIGPLSPREAARIMREVAWALAYAHGRGIVHRDIKPDNILIERGSGRAMVTDFGIARPTASAATSKQLTQEGQLIGTAAFMSPEQGAGEPVDGRSDIYALGGVGFFALTGRAPFEANTLEAILVARFTQAAPPVASARPDVPSALAAAIDRCLAREPSDRFQSAEALAEALSEGVGLGGAPDVAPPVRSFLRAAEQAVWLGSIIALFTIIYGLPTTRRLVPLVFGIVLGLFLLSIDLVRRARELLGEGFDISDVRRGFELERVAHAEEMRQLFDARRIAAWRRTRRRAWATLLVGMVLRVAVQLFFSRRLASTEIRPYFIGAMVLLDLVNTVSLVVALGSSPRRERRAFRIAAWLWRSPFGRAFFRLASLGRGRSSPKRAGARVVTEPRLEDLAPPSVIARYPDLRDTLRTVVQARDALRAREAEITRALTDAGGARPPAMAPDVSGVSDAPVASGNGRAREDGRANEHTLRDRRDALLGEMRDALETTRARRTTLTAALENVRIQLLRIGAGIGTPDDMRSEIATLAALVADSPSQPMVAST
ncbi:MAG: serine/threonine protein kinase [Gemmatimonadetes bacterium]|nr:serine/threonine protein kinase [Gemmatimonadota bacterium]